MYPQSKKRLISVGLAYRYGIDVIMGIQGYFTDFPGQILGWAEDIHPYQWVIDLSISESKAAFADNIKFIGSCLTQVDNSKVDLWHQRLGHLPAATIASVKKEGMMTGMSLSSVDLSKHVGCDGGCQSMSFKKANFRSI